VLHSTCWRWIWVDSWLLVVGNQIASFTFGRSFAYNLGFRCPNARPFWTFKLQDLSKNIKNTPMQGVLTPAIKLWVSESPRGLQVPTFGSVSFILTLSPKWGCNNHYIGKWFLEFDAIFEVHSPNKFLSNFSFLLQAFKTWFLVMDPSCFIGESRWQGKPYFGWCSKESSNSITIYFYLVTIDVIGFFLVVLDWPCFLSYVVNAIGQCYSSS
jgi:hypothetical protein